jgi:hypothetical protein
LREASNLKWEGVVDWGWESTGTRGEGEGECEYEDSVGEEARWKVGWDERETRREREQEKWMIGEKADVGEG